MFDDGPGLAGKFWLGVFCFGLFWGWVGCLIDWLFCVLYLCFVGFALSLDLIYLCL